MVALEPYVASLEASGGVMVEFVNPKYTDATRTAFKSPTRLECMMQVGAWVEVTGRDRGRGGDRDRVRGRVRVNLQVLHSSSARCRICRGYHL